MTGLALLGGNLVAGVLWDGPSATFYAGAAITAVALVGLLALQGRGYAPADGEGG
ncbi:MAG: hypothetical protein JKY68_03260 [Rhodospirillales bacterium]|nr:hypothetical protein [Rhodospirillales bacterium]